MTSRLNISESIQQQDIEFPTSDVLTSVPVKTNVNENKFSQWCKKHLNKAKIGLGIAITGLMGVVSFIAPQTLKAEQLDDATFTLSNVDAYLTQSAGTGLNGEYNRLFKVSNFYINTEGDTVAFPQDTSFTVFDTSSVHPIKINFVDTISGEGPLSTIAWRVIVTGIEDSLDNHKIKLVVEEWDSDLTYREDRDSLICGLGESFSTVITHSDTSTWNFLAMEGLSTIPYTSVNLSIEETQELSIDNESLKIMVYPNPSNSVANILLEDVNSPVKITDINGKVTEINPTIKNGVLTINTSELPSGVYIISYENSNDVKRNGMFTVIK